VSGNNDERELDRRHFLQCMAWVGTATVWGLVGGVPTSFPLSRANQALQAVKSDSVNGAAVIVP